MVKEKHKIYSYKNGLTKKITTTPPTRLHAINKQIKQWAEQLRNLMVISQMLGYQAEFMDKCPLTPNELKEQCRQLKTNTDRSIANIRNIKAYLKNHGKQSDAELISEELAQDKVFQLNEHMLFIAQFQNIDAITEILKTNVKTEI